MLTARTSHRSQRCLEMRPAAKQHGVVLLLTLIVLVAMTLAAIALVRSVDTTNVIAGNLAFRQGATDAGDVGTEAAIAWLEQHNGTTLFTNHATDGYFSTYQNLSAGQTWDQFWNNIVVPTGYKTVPGGPDAAGNTVSYFIERLCQNPLDPNDPGSYCSKSTVSVSTGSSQTSGSMTLTSANQVFYRITSRIDGPRNTVSYIQAVVAM